MRRALALLAVLPSTNSLSTPAGGWQAEAARLNAQAAQLRAEAGVLQESLLEERRAREQRALEPAVAVVAPSWDYPMVHGKVVLAEDRELVLRWQLRDGGTPRSSTPRTARPPCALIARVGWLLRAAS